MKSILRAAGMVMALVPAWAWAQALPREARIPGGVALLELPADYRPGDPVRFNGRRVAVVETDAGPRALVGLPLSLRAGRAAVQWRSAAGSRELPFEVATHDYPAQRITIDDPEKVSPGAANLKRIEREQVEILAAFRAWTDGAPELPLTLPAQGQVSSNFGLRRFINDQPRSPHSGIDIAAPAGAPVVAPAAGRVSQVGDYFFTGKTVFVDHGSGLVSLLCHLSEVSVEVGDRLAAGDRVGRVGATGRATGPHLHWGLSLNDARVDPRLFLAPPDAACHGC